MPQIEQAVSLTMNAVKLFQASVYILNHIGLYLGIVRGLSPHFQECTALAY